MRSVNHRELVITAVENVLRNRCGVAQARVNIKNGDGSYENLAKAQFHCDAAERKLDEALIAFRLPPLNLELR